ncbi:MAG: hypothetical protein ACYSW6_04940 [Planctomycetota bacterium]|jgi:hypothetical protein
MMTDERPTFILVIDSEGVRSLVNASHITKIGEIVTAGGVPAVTAKILGQEKPGFIAAGPDSLEYFTWLMDELDTLDFWEHTHEEQDAD